MKIAIVSLFLLSPSALVYAYPGAQQPRRIPVSTETAMSSSTATMVDTSMTSDSLLTFSSRYLQSTQSVPPAVTTTSAAITSSPLLTLNHLAQIDILEEDDDEDVDGDYDDDCSEESEEKVMHRRDGEMEQECTVALSKIQDQLNDIKAMLQATPSPSIASKRQADNLVEQEHAFGDQGRDLKSEQQAALEALVKGIDGYQASSEGATNTDQTEQEIWQQTAQTVESLPLLASLSPVQIEDLLSQLGALLHQGQVGKKSSASSLGSQAGQTISQASWMVPLEGTLRDAGYSANSNVDNVKETASTAPPNAADLLLLTHLELLQRQEQSLINQIQASRDGQLMQNSPFEQSTNSRLFARSTANQDYIDTARKVMEWNKPSARMESFGKRLLDLLLE